MTRQAESTAPKRRARRRQYIVDKPFQYQLIGLLLSVWVANSAFFAFILYTLYRTYGLMLQPSFALFPLVIGFVLFFGIVLVGLVGVYLSNQIAGPLYRIKVSLTRVAQGDVSFEVRFRERDFLRDLPAYFNTMLQSLRTQCESDLEALKAIEANLDDAAPVMEAVRELREKKQAQLGLASDQPAGETAGVESVL